MSPQSRTQSSHLSSPFHLYQRSVCRVQAGRGVTPPRRRGTLGPPGGAPYPPSPRTLPAPSQQQAAPSTPPIAVRSAASLGGVRFPFAMQTAFQLTDHFRGEETPE